MSFTHWLAGLALLPLAVTAQEKQQPLDPWNASAAVPASTYESPFKNYKPAADEPESPEKTWRTANDEVGRLGGHAGHMKVETSASAPAPATPRDHGKRH
ncbi:MAG: hypothetical protein V7642_6733 [Burkholderiales bacterium]|jgi:hypothetical protein